MQQLSALSRRAKTVAEAEWFTNFIAAIIVVNALTIGINTYPIGKTGSHIIDLVDQVFLAIFVAELVIRLAAVSFNPRRFFANGWNTFDFLIVAVCFIPGLTNNTTLLRLVRLARVTRLVKLMPDARVLADGLRRAAGPALSLLAFTALMCYIYAIVGYVIFHDRTPTEMPHYFENVGEGMLTLFELLTLEGWNTILHDLRQISPLAFPYVITFLLFGTYVVINLVVGVVINSVDNAYQHHHRTQRAEVARLAGRSVAEIVDDLKELTSRLEDLSAAADVAIAQGEHGDVPDPEVSPLRNPADEK